MCSNTPPALWSPLGPQQTCDCGCFTNWPHEVAVLVLGVSSEFFKEHIEIEVLAFSF